MRPLVAAVGDPLRGDDGVGPAVVEHLAGDPSIEADLEVVRVPARLPTLWEGRPLVVIIDAVRGRDPVGTVVEVDPTIGADSRLFGTTHGFGVGEVVSLARELEQLPTTLRLIGVVGRRWGLAQQMSAEVQQAVPVVADEVRRILAGAGDSPSTREEPVRSRGDR